MAAVSISASAANIAVQLKGTLSRYEGLGWYANNRFVYYNMDKSGRGKIAVWVPYRYGDQPLEVYMLDPEGRTVDGKVLSFNAQDVIDADDLGFVAEAIRDFIRQAKEKVA